MDHKDKRPNIVWIMSDQHSAAFSGCYGHPVVKTPNIDALARQATLFRQAYTTCPMCIPARFAMLTGKYGNRTGTTFTQPLSHRERTAAHMLREAGYSTAMIGKLHPSAPQPHGFDYYIDFPHYLDYMGPKSEIFIRNMGARDSGCGYPYVDGWYQEGNDALRLYLEEGRTYPEDARLAEIDHFERFVAANADQYIKQSAADDQPFFLFASFLKPHFPHDSPERFHDMYNPDDLKLPKDIFDVERLSDIVAYGAANKRGDVKKSGRDLTFYDFLFGRCPDLHIEEGRSIARRRMADYFASVTFMDECFGMIIDSLKQNGTYDDTMIIYTADHGEMLFSHGLVQKFVFYDQSVHIPMIMKAPYQEQPSATDSLIDLTDLLPTSLAACGMAPPEGIDGVDQSSVFTGGVSGKTAVYSQLRERRMMMFDGRYKFCIYEDCEQLFDMDNDPGEHCDLSKNGGYTEICRRMRSELVRWNRPV